MDLDEDFKIYYDGSFIWIKQGGGDFKSIKRGINKITGFVFYTQRGL